MERELGGHSVDREPDTHEHLLDGKPRAKETAICEGLAHRLAWAARGQFGAQPVAFVEAAGSATR